VEALRQYILSLGASQSILQLEWDGKRNASLHPEFRPVLDPFLDDVIFAGIWATNKKVIDPVAPRFYAVEKENALVM
jgi:glutamyl-tRNA synthetase